jgi:outer membrane protein assembly factor BamB
MKKLLIVSFISLLGLTIYAQSELKIKCNEISIGKNFRTNKDIIANEILFPKHIYRCHLDTCSKSITVQLISQTESGKILNYTRTLAVYDLEKKREKWSKKLHNFLDEIDQHDGLIIQVNQKKSYSLNFENGEEQWEVKNTIYYSDSKNKIGIGYRFKDFDDMKDELEAIDLLNGNTIWKTKLTREYGWDGVFHLNDSTIIIVAAGLHSVNIKTGKGWDYNTLTGEMHYTGRTGQGLSDLLMGPSDLPANKLVRSVDSNVLVDSISLYFASREKIARLNHSGQVIWKTPLPIELTSSSSIFKRDSVIYMINFGNAMMGYKNIHYGNPFIAAFNSNTGRQIFLNTTNGKRDEINDFEIRKDKLFLVLRYGIAAYSLHDGSFISEKKFKVKPDEEFVSFTGNRVYIKSDSIYKSLALADSTTHCISTLDGKIKVLNDKFELIKEIDISDLYFCYIKENGYTFLVKDNKTIVIDENSKVVAKIDIAIISKPMGTKFYTLDNKSFIELDINDLIRNNTPAKGDMP